VDSLSEADWLQIERDLCARSLVEFIRQAWHVLEPGQPYIHGNHMDLMAANLEAVTNGDINRLLINVPPGTMKSMCVSVFWPAWEWGPRGMGHMRFIGASHEEGLATRDSMKMRHLVQSDWYQKLWPTPFMGDQNEKKYFQNDKTGWRQACPVRSMTGKRGDRVVWDDPHSVEDAHSPAALETANRIFRETLPTRLNNPDKSAIIIVMQRLNQSDISGYIIEHGLGYEHLCLPMEYEPAARKATTIGPGDWRTSPGELLFPGRFSRETVERDKKIMGDYAVAGQFQQRPSPASGGIMKPDMLKIVDAIPANIAEWCRGWDLASTLNGDYTAGVKLGRLHDGRYIIADVVRERLESHQRDQLMRNTADRDRIKQSIPQDPGQAGKSQVLAMAKLLAGHGLHFSPETGDKTVRATPLASQINVGNVLMLRAPWNQAFIDEARLFPASTYDDQVDAASRAFNALLRPQAGIFT